MEEERRRLYVAMTRLHLIAPQRAVVRPPGQLGVRYALSVGGIDETGDVATRPKNAEEDLSPSCDDASCSSKARSCAARLALT
jgi:hypothetical protein